jgi:hypothetical protein
MGKGGVISGRISDNIEGEPEIIEINLKVLCN